MIRAFLFALCFIPHLLKSQPADFVTLQKTGQSNFKLVYSDYYDGKSLWGYMDGGADLYLEYGFEGLLVQEINYNGSTIKCEIFKMTDALGAFGIFSVQRHKCKLTTSIDAIHCINNYQLQLVKGSYYLSLINQAGDSTAQYLSVEIANWFSAIIEKKDIAFPDHPYFKSKTQNLIFLKGKISMSNVYPQGLNYLDNASDYDVWLLPSSNKKEPVVSLINFKKEADLTKYAEAAFPGVTLDNIAKRKLKKGKNLLARKIDKTTVLQAEGNTGKETGKILGFE